MRGGRPLVVLVCLLSAACDCGPSANGPVEAVADRGCTRVTEGCPCTGDAPTRCFDGDEQLSVTGMCAAGTRYSLDGFWGTCEGQILPIQESCGDEVDNDCDGTADEGARCDCQDGCVVEDDGCFAAGVAAGLEQED